MFAHFDVEHDRNPFHAHRGHFFVGKRNGLAARAHEAGHAARIAHDIPSARIHHEIDGFAAALLCGTLFFHHVHEHFHHYIAGKYFSLGYFAFSVGQNLDGFLRGVFHLKDDILKPCVLHGLFKVFLDLVFITRVGMNHVPFCFLHAHNSLPDFDSAQCAKPTRECQVEKTDEKRHCQNKDDDRQCVAEEFLARKPGKLLHFANHLPQEAE